MSENNNSIVVTSRVREYAKQKAGENGVRLDGDFVEALDGKVKELIDDAFARAQSNKRATLRGTDL